MFVLYTKIERTAVPSSKAVRTRFYEKRPSILSFSLISKMDPRLLSFPWLTAPYTHTTQHTTQHTEQKYIFEDRYEKKHMIHNVEID